MPNRPVEEKEYKVITEAEKVGYWYERCQAAEARVEEYSDVATRVDFSLQEGLRAAEVENDAYTAIQHFERARSLLSVILGTEALHGAESDSS